MMTETTGSVQNTCEQHLNYQRQLELETEMFTRGIERFQKALATAQANGEESTSPATHRLLRLGVDPLATALEAFIEAADSGKAGRRHIAVRFLSDTDSYVAAFIALRVALDEVSSKPMAQHTALAIGSALEDEARFRFFIDSEITGKDGTIRKGKALFGKIKESLKHCQNRRHKRRVLVHSLNKVSTWEAWTETDKLHLGMKMLELVVASTGVITLTLTREGRKTVQRVEATPEIDKWINDQNGRLEGLSPWFLPMIMPPKEWSTPFDGGYLCHTIRPLTLVKTPYANYLEELRYKEMPAVYTAVNALQNTAWAINTDVLDTMEKVFYSDRLMRAGLPELNDVVPKRDLVKPEDFLTNPESMKKWKKQAAEMHRRNHKLRSERIQVAKAMSVARKFRDEAAIYYPYQLDFRGRAYCVPGFLNPQGPDYAKALLHFSEGKAITTPEAACWLAIAGANLYGYDKVSLDERVQWVDAHKDEILASAANPMENLFWCGQDVDKPWQFLAWCMDFAGFISDGYGYVSHFAVALDGSCNGIQNYSAALRDPIGGAAVNLIPSSTPADIYQRVADVVKGKLRIMERDASDTTKALLAHQWLAYGISRKTTKRPVMVLPYGGTRYSARDFVQAHAEERIKKNDCPTWAKEEMFKATVFLSAVIWDSIGEVVVAAREAMAWLQKVAAQVADEGLPINWTAPSGFPVLQAYPETASHRVETKFGDKVIFLTLEEAKFDITGNPIIDKRRSANAIAPNTIHSFDASHQAFTLESAVEQGLTSFCFIHDSYGTHAADTEVLSVVLREQFVRMYETHDVFTEFRQAMLGILPEGIELPEAPAKGTLDLKGVLESDFFFA